MKIRTFIFLFLWAIPVFYVYTIVSGPVCLPSMRYDIPAGYGAGTGAYISKDRQCTSLQNVLTSKKSLSPLQEWSKRLQPGARAADLRNSFVKNAAGILSKVSAVNRSKSHPVEDTSEKMEPAGMDSSAVVFPAAYGI